MATGAVIARILSQYSDKGSKAAQKDIAKLGKRIDAFGKKATKSFALLGAATAAYAIKLGVDAVKGAAADERQQTALAIALRNTTGATDAAIAANAKYLDSLELQVAIDNEKLIPALQQLVTATGNLTQGQALLSLSTDVAAASGKDLSAVSAALSKAVNGNFGALTKLGLPLDANAIKAKDLGKVLTQLATISKGQASAAANTFSGQVAKLGLAFNQIKDQIGLAFMPELSRMVFYIENKVLPNLQAFLDMNKYKLTDALATTTKNLQEIARAFGNIFNFIEKVNNILPVGIAGWIQIAAVIKGLTIVYGALTIALGVYIAVQTIAEAKTQSATVSSRALLTQLTMNATGYTANAAAIAMMHTKMMAGSKIYAAIALGIRHIGAALKLLIPKPILLLIIAMTAVYTIGKKIIGSFEKQKVVMTDAAKAGEAAMRAGTNYSNSMDAAHDKYKKNQEEKASMTEDEKKQAALLAAMEAKNAKDQARRDAAEAKRNVILARLKKMTVTIGASKAKIKGITPTSSLEAAEQEAISLRAAELLLLKAKDNALETEKLKKLRERVALQEISNKLAERYSDILVALADNTISDKDIIALAGKWKTTTDVAKMYVQQVLGLGSLETGEAKVAMLMSTWGMTNKQAKMYIDFTDLIKKGNYSTADIERVGAAHGLNADEAKKYYTYYKLIMDGELSDADILAIKQAYSDTNLQIVEMIEKLGVPVKVTGNILDASLIARLETHWIAAKKAMDEYYKALGAYGDGGITMPKTVTPPTVTGCPTGSTMINGKCTPIGTNPKTQDPAASAADAAKAAADAKAAASAASARAYAAAKAAGDSDAAAKAAAGVNPSALAASESGAIGAASIAAQLKAAEIAQRAADIAAAQATQLANFRAKEAADEAAANARAASNAVLDADERAKFRAMQDAFNSSTADTPTGKFKTPTMDNAKGLMGSGGNGGTQNIYVTVQGTVTGEQDLVQTIRNGLLRGQYNGQSTVLEAI
jgi:hypothetical protein